MIFCDREICGNLDCRDARSMASLVIPSTEDFVTNIHHLKCKVIQLARRQMQKEVPIWSERMINRGSQRVVGAQERTIPRAQKPQIPAQSVTAFAAEGGEVQNLQRIPEREMSEKIDYSSASLNNDSTIFHPEPNRSNHHSYDSNPEMIQRDRSRDWNPEMNENDQSRHWQRESNQSDQSRDRHRETNQNDRSYDQNPENSNQNDEIYDHNRSNDSNEGQNGYEQRTEVGRLSNSVFRWTKKILSMNFPIYWIVIVVGILGAASLVCGVLIGAVLCANGNRSFPFFLRMKSRSGHAAY